MAYDFDGTNDRIDNTTADGVAGIDVDTYSVSFWYIRNDAPVSETFFFFGTGASSGGKCGFLWLSGTLTLRQEYSTDRGDWTIADPSQDAWHNIVITFDRTNDTTDPIIYVDGTSVTVTQADAPNGTRSGGEDNLALGEVMAGSSDLDATMAEFAFWDVVLTAGEAATLGARYSPLFVRPSNRVLYIPLIREVVELEQGIALTLAGASVVAHPSIIYPTQPISGFAAAAAPSAADPVAGLALLGAFANQSYQAGRRQ